MLKNYLTIALRALRQHKGYALLNVVGLAVGLACCLTIALFVRAELSYDRHHANADRIYRVHVAQQTGSVHTETIDSPAPLAAALSEAFPEVERAARFGRMWGGVLSHEDRQYHEADLFIADPAVFEVFDLPLVRGDAATALEAPESIVLTEAMAHKYFGDTDPMGQTLTFTFEGSQDFVVTGVVEAPPRTSHFHFDFLVSFASQGRVMGRFGERWDFNFAPTYVLLRDPGSAARIEAQLPDFVAQRYPETHREETVLSLQPLTNIHLHSHAEGEFEPNGSPALLYLLGSIALVILLLACINFMNLATARSAGRAKEVGLRKTMGALRSHLIRQFLGEAVVLTCLAAVLALVLTHAFLPVFNDLTGAALTLSAGGWLLPVALIVLVALVGVVAGGYPAFVLSSFQPAEVLKGRFAGTQQGALLRQGLVVSQFATTIFFLVGIGVVHEQLDYLRTKNRGFDEEQLLYIRSPQREEPMDFAVYQSELERAPGVLRVAGTGRVLGSGDELGTVDVRTAGMTEADQVPIGLTMVHPDFFETYGLAWAWGGEQLETVTEGDSLPAYVVNETAARMLGLGSEQAGEALALYSDNAPEPFQQGRLLGVVEDFHFESLHAAIRPLVLIVLPEAHTWTYLVVRARMDDLPATLAHIETTWKELAPEWPLELTFLDERFGTVYASEARLSRILSVFTMLAILIACLGLFGLAAFTATQRTKEIGIRKVLGASIPSLVGLLSKNFLRLVALAFVLAVPPAYLAAGRWLDGFAYRIDLGVGVFALAGGLALVVALATVSYHALRAALSDPVKSLRYE